MRPCDQASYSDLFLRMLDAIFLLDPNTYEIRDANDAGERLLEFDREKFLGRSFLDWFPDSERSEFEKNLRIAKRKYYPRNWDSRFGLDSSKQIDAYVSACVLKLADGSELIQAIVRDVTVERANARSLVDLNKRLELMSHTDEMTQLFNYRYFKTQLEKEHDRCKRYSRNYSIVFLDADNFKHYNDRNGHPAGDVLLKEIAALVKANCRINDFPARYGGEEFVVILPETDSNSAVIFAERLRKSIASKKFPHGEAQPLGLVSISIGIASYPVDGKLAEDILAKADAAVYFSKKSGRNRVTEFNSIPKDFKSEDAA